MTRHIVQIGHVDFLRLTRRPTQHGRDDFLSSTASGACNSPYALLVKGTVEEFLQ